MEKLRLNELSLSEQTKVQIQKYIYQMDLKKSNKLPREETLAEMIGVSRITIRAALNDLASQGLIFRRQGKGTFVNVDSLNIKVKFNPAMEFTQMIKDSGYQPSVKLLNIKMVPWDKRIGELLQGEPEEKLVLTEKFFMANEKICSYCRDYFTPSLIGGVEAFEQFSQYENSVFDYIYNLSGAKIEWDKVEIDTAISTEVPDLYKYTDMKEMGIKSLLLLRGVNYSTEDKPLVYAEEYIDTSLIKFSMIRQRMIHYH
ncbi:MAG: GntR family transcriptional regulator [Acetivibrio sp.]